MFILIVNLFFSIYYLVIRSKHDENEKRICSEKYDLFKDIYLNSEFRDKYGLPNLNYAKSVVKQKGYETIIYQNKSKKNYPLIEFDFYYCVNNSEDIYYKLNNDSTLISHTFFSNLRITKTEFELITKMKNFYYYDFVKSYNILKKTNLINNKSIYFYNHRIDSLEKIK